MADLLIIAAGFLVGFGTIGVALRWARRNIRQTYEPPPWPRDHDQYATCPHCGGGL